MATFGKAEQKDSSSDDEASCCQGTELVFVDGICLIETPDRRQRAAWGPELLRIIDRSGSETMLALTERGSRWKRGPRKARALGTNKARANSPVHHAFVIFAAVCQRLGLRRSSPCLPVTHWTVSFQREVEDVTRGGRLYRLERRGLQKGITLYVNPHEPMNPP